MKKQILLLLAAMILVSSAGCGKKASTETSGQTTAKTAEKQENADSASNSSDPKKEEKQESAAVSADPAMVELANSNIQTKYSQIAFDDTYIYFPAKDQMFRCRYDGSEVTAVFDKELTNAVAADGKLWGYYHTRKAEEQSALYSIDLQTLSAAPEIETNGGWDEDYITSILISGNRMFYVARDGLELVDRDMTTGEEKTICKWTEEENATKDISMCLYGDTLYVLFYSSPSDYRYSLCSYDLGGNADELTEVATFSNNGPRAWIWTEDGLLIPGSSQFYHAGWSDVKDGKWDYRKDENKVGSEFDNTIFDRVGDNFNRSRYVLGNDLLVIDFSDVFYYKDFDFAAEQKLLKLEGGSFGANTKPHGMHDGSVYIYNWQDKEILKISEGGNVEHIPVTIP